jgi:hypothetical protein
MGFLPAADAAYLAEKRISYEEVQDGAQKGIVLRSYGLPSARFDAGAADILILLPRGYPDVPPDMFYLLPWVRLKAGNRYPKAADQAFTFRGNNWQRWSRHNPEWRPGVDGIWTMLNRIDNALEVAAA